MDYTVLLLLLLHGAGAVEVIHEFYYIDLKMLWTEAQQYCRSTHTDLATLRSMDDTHSVQWSTSYVGLIWIGLSDNPASWKGVMSTDPNSWRWTATGTVSPTKYQNWTSSNPNNGYGKSFCTKISSGQWDDVVCSDSMVFICFTGSAQGPKEYTLIETNLTFWDAAAFCRANYTDLAMIENQDENAAAWSSAAGHTEAWIGLYRKGWTWADGSESSFTNWNSGEPNNGVGSENCGAVKSADLKWVDVVCARYYPFVCQKVITRSKVTTVKVELQAAAGLTDAVTSAQILQQIADVLMRRGFGDVKVQWAVHP